MLLLSTRFNWKREKNVAKKLAKNWSYTNLLCSILDRADIVGMVLVHYLVPYSRENLALHFTSIFLLF